MESQPPGWDQDGFQPDGWQPDAVDAGGDTTPDPFGFVSQSGVALSTLIQSAPLNITGFDTATTISILAGLEYSLDGGANYVVADGTIEPGTAVRARIMSSAVNSDPKTGTLIVGGVSGTFTVTTLSLIGEITPRFIVRVGGNQVVMLDPEDECFVTLDWTDVLSEDSVLASVEHTASDPLVRIGQSTDPEHDRSQIVVSGARHGQRYSLSAKATLVSGEVISRSIPALGFEL